ADLELKANSLNAQPISEGSAEGTRVSAKPRTRTPDTKVSSAMDDGRQMLHKLFVESKVIAQGDFDLCWVTQDLSTPPGKIIEPFIQNLADKSILPMEKALKIMSDKHRIAYLPLD